jgi:hypothetical protein
MLRGGCDGLGDHLRRDGRVDQLAAQVLQQAQCGGHGQAAPAAAGPVEHGPHQRQARALAGEPADDLHPSAGLTEGALDEVRVPDALPVLGREPQVHGERREVVGDARDRSRVAGLPLRRWPRSRPSPPPGRALTPWRSCCGRGGSGSAGAGWCGTFGRRRHTARVHQRTDATQATSVRISPSVVLRRSWRLQASSWQAPTSKPSRRSTAGSGILARAAGARKLPQ